MTSSPHIPVLVRPVVAAFNALPIKVIVDGTVGAGGHAFHLLEAHPEIEYYVAIDQDPQALALASEKLKPWNHKVFFKRGNFIQFPKFLAELSLTQADAILVDLGVSSMQLDQPERGFSFMRDGPLDMRMNPENGLTAETIVNQWSEQEMGKIFRDYGEEKKWRLAARAIAEGRKNGQIKTTAELAAVLKPVLGHYSKKGLHPLTLVFQALRICVNQELQVLEDFLLKAIEALAPRGRLAVISFHSLEDRLVKNKMRWAASDKWDTVGQGGVFLDKTPIAKLITKKPLEADDLEVKGNPRSRSAKLRVLEKLELEKLELGH